MNALELLPLQNAGHRKAVGKALELCVQERQHHLHHAAHAVH